VAGVCAREQLRGREQERATLAVHVERVGVEAGGSHAALGVRGCPHLQQAVEEVEQGGEGGELRLARRAGARGGLEPGEGREEAGQRLALASAQAHHAREAGRPCACVCVCVCVGRSGLEEMVIGWGLDRGWHRW